MTKHGLKFLIILCLVYISSPITAYTQTKKELVPELWLTDPTNSIYFRKQAVSKLSITSSFTDTISIDEHVRYQQMDGFGFSLTGGSAIVINSLDIQKRKLLLEELFSDKGYGIGISYLRLSIGSSDLSDHIYSYDDMPAGLTDTLLKNFSIAQEQKDVIPLLKDIIKINPKIKLMASPWSAPLWMKTNNNAMGGSLKPTYMAVYARYLLKYLNAMTENGIKIDAITVQNEPLHPGNNPSMYMSAQQQNDFVKRYLGPLFAENNTRTKIVIYDHNLDRIDYPLTLLDDQETNRYIEGTAFHLYAGDIAAMTYIHQKYPSKSLYFTEQWINSQDSYLSGNLIWHTKNLIIGAPRNWSKNVLEWNLAADASNGPHTEKPGCDICLGGITIDHGQITRNPAYYIIAHASKFVRPGSYRIGSSGSETLPNIAYITPEGKKILIILNNTNAIKNFIIIDNKQQIVTCLKPGSEGSYIW